MFRLRPSRSKTPITVAHILTSAGNFTYFYSMVLIGAILDTTGYAGCLQIEIHIT